MAGKKNKLDPRQVNFLRFLNDPNSETFGNHYQSALKAKYSKSYAEHITVVAGQGLSEDVRRRERLLNKSEQHFEETLNQDIMEPAMGPFGPIIDKKTKKPIMRRSNVMIGLKNDLSKFIAETAGKKYYSRRQELGGPNGEKLIIQVSREIAEKNDIDSSPKPDSK